MDKGICPVTLLPIRSEPSHQSEMTSVLLFGELFEITETRENWLYIKCEWDDFRGWVEESGILLVTPAFFREACDMNVIAREHHLAFEYSKPEHPYRILPGSSLPFYRPDNQSFSIGQKTLKLDSQPVMPINGLTAEDATKAALMFMHTPYVWGGRSLFGIDAGGFIQVILKICRIRVSRNLKDQVNAGTSVHFLDEAKPGNLLFFGEENEGISHAGILMAPGQVIHPYGKVRIDRIDHHGIYNENRLTYTHHLRTIINIPALSLQGVKE